MVSFSESNIYIGTTRTEDRQFAAPADQVGDDHLDLDAFEQSKPGELAPSSDPGVLVGALEHKAEVYAQREVRAIRHIRQAKREAATLRIQMKGKQHLYRSRLDRKRKIIAGLQNKNEILLGKNQRFQKHSADCKIVLKKWKTREEQLLNRVGERERKIERMKAQMEAVRREQEAMKQAHISRVADLSQQVSELQLTKENLESAIIQLKHSLSEMTTKNKEFEDQVQHVQEKEAQLASVRVALQSQLEFLVSMTSPAQ